MDDEFYTFYWKSGKIEVYEGDNVFDAFKKAGYRHADEKNLAFTCAGRKHHYIWNPKTKEWESKPKEGKNGQ